MQHFMSIPRVNIESHVRSGIRYQPQDMAFAMASALGDSDGALHVVARVAPAAGGSELHLSLDTSGLPFRYRLLMIEPVLRRAHGMVVQKMTRRAAEVAASART